MKLFKLLRYIIVYRLVPSRIFLKLRFKKYQGYKLNLNHPKSLNEKIQWLKLHDRKTINQICADKYLVREFVTNVIGSEYLIKLIDKFESVDNFRNESLPKQPFVIKTNNGCGQVLLYKDFESIDLHKLKSVLKKWVNPINNIYYYGKEWQYKNIKPVIILEELLNDNGKIPNDYKFHCFNGKVEFIYISIDREGINKRAIFDRNWGQLNFTWSNDINKKYTGTQLEKPMNLQKMIELSEKIAQYFKYVRVDLYSIKEKIYFGEITLHHASGFDRIDPVEWDIFLGQKLNLDKEPDLSWG